MSHPHSFHPRSRKAVLTTGLAGMLLASAAGCRKTPAQAANGQDPADANMAQPYTGGDTGGYSQGGAGQTQVAGQTQSYTPQSSGESFETQAPAPIIRKAPAGSEPTQYYPVPQAGSSSGAAYQDPGQSTAYDPNAQGYADQSAYSQGYSDAEEAGEQALAETDQPPPPLPEYDQPPAPEDNYIWTPGYWNYANTGYYWVPGVWCAPPFIGALWTPPWWGYYNNHYLFHRGYWGPHVGYYGGVNYGFGYIGTGYFGGYWNHRDFYYNRAVTNVNVTNIHNVYTRTVVYDNHTFGPHPENRVSYNGGRGGLNYQPRPGEVAAMREAHYAPVAAQRDNRLAAAQNRAQFFQANHGRPQEAFATRPLGTVNNLPTTPREQAFNHPGSNGFNGAIRPGAPNQPGFNGNPRAAETNRPGGVNQPGFNGNARTGAPNQPGYAGSNRTGEINRSGIGTQPAFSGNTRPGAPNQPGANGANRPGEINRPSIASQPALNEHRTSNFNRPGDANQPGVGNRPGTSNQPAEDNNRFRQGGIQRPGSTVQPAPNTTGQPTINNNRPGASFQPGGNRPEDFHRNPGFTPGGGRPNVEQPRAQPAPNTPLAAPSRPAFEQPRMQQAPQIQRSAPQPQVAPHAQPSAPRPASPAPAAAPHTGGGGGEHGHH